MLRNFKLLFLDVDGTMTDGRIYMGEHGEVMKAFNIKDGLGIKELLVPHGIRPVVITGRESAIVENRCRELGITEIYQGVGDKAAKLREVVAASGVNLAETAYMGDDLNDLLCMTEVRNGGGVIACPADAAEDIKKICDFISAKNGGDGAVREFAEWILLGTEGNK